MYVCTFLLHNKYFIEIMGNIFSAKLMLCVKSFFFLYLTEI